MCFDGKQRQCHIRGDEVKRELYVKEEGQEYAQVIKMLGNGRLDAMCFDGKQRQCHIRGKMRKKVWVNKGDIILLGLRDYQDDKADVIHKFKPEEIKELKQRKELPEREAFVTTDKLEEETPYDF